MRVWELIAELSKAPAGDKVFLCESTPSGYRMMEVDEVRIETAEELGDGRGQVIIDVTPIED